MVDLDDDRARATKLAIAANLGGLGLGPLLAGMLAQWAPRPLRLVYLVELVLLAVGLAVHVRLPETVPRRGFELDLRSLRPPAEMLPTFVPAAVAGVAAFGVSGVLGATGPAMLRAVFDIDDPIAPGVLLCLSFGCGIAGQFAARLFHPVPALVGGCAGLALAVTLLAVALDAAILPALVLAAVASGLSLGVIVGAGLSLLTTRAPQERRGQVASAYFLATYIGLVVPVVGFGVAQTSVGLVDAGLLFSVLVGLAALASGLSVRRFASA